MWHKYVSILTAIGTFTGLSKIYDGVFCPNFATFIFYAYTMAELSAFRIIDQPLVRSRGRLVNPSLKFIYLWLDRHRWTLMR